MGCMGITNEWALGGKKTSFLSCSSKQKYMKFKKKNDIKRNSTKCY